jgi:hypothetical protein
LENLRWCDRTTNIRNKFDVINRKGFISILKITSLLSIIELISVSEIFENVVLFNSNEVYFLSSELFEKFENQYTEPCNGNCGMNYCDDNGCLENKPKSEGEDVDVISV